MVSGHSHHINQVHAYQHTPAPALLLSKLKSKKGVKMRTLPAYKIARLNSAAIIVSISMVHAQTAHADDKPADDKDAQIKTLNQQLEEARAAENTAEQRLAEIEEPSSADIKLGPVTVGGAMRVNYVNGDYVKSGEQP